MNKTALLFSLVLTVASYASCSNNSIIREDLSLKDTTSRTSIIQVDTAYVPTGFYFVTDERNDAITMYKENSGKYYLLIKTPFVSVTNIKKAELRAVTYEEKNHTDLCLICDAKGTRDLEEGTGNPLYPKIAVVIAGELLYVVENTYKLTNGSVCIGVNDYSEEKRATFKNAVNQKR